MAKYKIIPSSRTIVQSPISIGHKAEKGVEAIEFDLTAWVETYGSGTLTVIMRRWGDVIPYPIALEIDENNKATWTLSDIDTAKVGMAYAQLNYIVGDEVVKKSDIYTFRVMDSLTGEGDPPEAYESWLENLTHFAAEAMAEVLDIEGIVTDKTLTVDGGIADAKATGDALALKADKSTTYTKTEVDQMIEDVEVETDTTLEVAGAAADAAETGRQIGLLKADLEEKITIGRTTLMVPAGTTHSSLIDRVMINAISTDKVGFVIKTNNNVSVTIFYKETESGTNIQLLTGKNIDGTYIYALTTYNHAIYDIGLYINNGSGQNDVSVIIEAYVEPSNNLSSANDILLRKASTCFAYCSDLSWQINGNTCNLTVNATIRVRFDIVNASVDTTREQLLSIAQASTAGVTVTDGVISGMHFAIVFDFGTNAIKVVDTSARSTFINTAILFYWHYGVLGGILVNNKTALIATQNIGDIADIRSQINNQVEDYFITEAETCKNSLIADCGEKAFVIAFTTDNHYGANNGMNFPTTVKTIERVNELYPIDIVIDGGDLINGDETKANAMNRMCSAVSMLCGIKGNAYTLKGNHDDDSYTVTAQPLFSKAELYAMMCRHEGIVLDNVDDTEQYGYKDYPQYGLRVIFLDALYGTNGHVSADWGYSDAELAWFTSDALNTSYQIVMFSHMPFTQGFNYNNNALHNGAEMRSAVESFIVNGGMVVGLFHGHTHWDYIGQYSQSNGFHEVSTGCGRVVSGPIPSGVAHPDGATMPERTAGTVTQELWDIIIIKPESRTVNMVRFGAGDNRNFTY